MQGSKKNRKRKVTDIPIFLDERLWRDLENLVDKCKWPYKSNNESDYQQRDQALVCLLILTGLRISELLKLRKLQFRIYKSRIELANVQTLKHGELRKKIILPKRGSLAYFTRKFENWLVTVPTEDSYVFPRGRYPALEDLAFFWNKPLGRKRVYWIIHETTNRFPHWFRSVTETIYGRLVFRSDAWKLKEFMGLRRLDSTSAYVKGSWEEDIDRIYNI